MDKFLLSALADKTVQGALIGATAMIMVALLTLVGVLWRANRDYRLGLLTEKNKTDAQQQTADNARIAQLSTENKDLRQQMNEIWDDLRELRSDFDAECEKHKGEKETLEKRIATLEETVKQKDVIILAREQLIAAQETQLAAHQEQMRVQQERIAELSSAQAVAAQAQELAEAGMKTAEKILWAVVKPPEAANDSGGRQ